MRSIVCPQPLFRPTATRRSSGGSGRSSLGIGLYSLTKMGSLPIFAICVGGTCFGLWTAGITMRWFEGIVGWQWRVLLPLSALFELAAFFMFFRTVSRHRAAASAGGAMLQVGANPNRGCDGDGIDPRVSGDAGVNFAATSCKSP